MAVGCEELLEEPISVTLTAALGQEGGAVSPPPPPPGTVVLEPGVVESGVVE